jgi:hypothetical protein
MSTPNEFTDIITINESVGMQIESIQAEVDPKLFKGRHFMAIHTSIIADHGWIILRRKDLIDMLAELDRSEADNTKFVQPDISDDDLAILGGCDICGQFKCKCDDTVDDNDVCDKCGQEPCTCNLSQDHLS